MNNLSNLSMKPQPLCCTGTANHCCSSSEECGIKGDKVGGNQPVTKVKWLWTPTIKPQVSLPPFLEIRFSQICFYFWAPRTHFHSFFSSLLDFQAVCVGGRGAYGYTCVKVDGLSCFPCVSMCVCVCVYAL